MSPRVSPKPARSAGSFLSSALLVSCLFAVTAIASAPSLLLNLDFEDRSTVNRVDGRRLVSRHIGFTPGIDGLALELTGHPEQAVEIGVPGFGQPATLALWIKRSPSPQAHKDGIDRPEYLQEHERRQGRLISRTGGEPGQRLAGALRVGPEKLELWHGRGWTPVIAASIPEDRWVHLAVVFSADGTATGYLNGVRDLTVKAAFDGRESSLALASASVQRRYGYPFAGCIDDFRLYQGSLSDEEIMSLAKRARSL